MKLSTGKVAFKIEFDNGDTGVIYLNPNDKELRERIIGFEKNVEMKAKQIDIEKYKNKFENKFDIEINLDDLDSIMALSPDQVKDLYDRVDIINNVEKEYNDIIKDELDNVFGSNISSTAFRYCEPFDMVIIEDENGNEKSELYIIHFLHWLSAELKKYADKNSQAMNKHIKKYVK